MKIIEFFFSEDWMEYKVIYRNRTTKHVDYFREELEIIGGIRCH